jgi:hypothetical protein
MGARVGIILLLTLAACSPSSASTSGVTASSSARTPPLAIASAAATSTPNPPSAPLAVMVGSSQPDTQTVSLVDRNGNVVASTTAPVADLEAVPLPGTVTAQVPTHQYGIGNACCGVELPEVGTSNRRAYFVSGSNELRFLAEDGTTGVAAILPNVKGRTQAVFAVSPDDRRIALSVFDWSVRPMRVTLLVEDLSGANRVSIFSSTSVYEWPVAWHAGLLVVAVGSVLGGPPNPYAAVSYHVADSTSGLRQATLGSNACHVVGPLVTAGTACSSVCTGGDVHNVPAGAQACLSAVDWFGKQRVLYRYKDPNGILTWAALSPDGNAVAIEEGGPPLGNYVVRADGSQVKLPDPNGPVVWWLDADTIALLEASASATNVAFYRLSTGQLIPVADNLGLIQGVVPGLS